MILYIEDAKGNAEMHEVSSFLCTANGKVEFTRLGTKFGIKPGKLIRVSIYDAGVEIYRWDRPKE